MPGLKNHASDELGQMVGMTNRLLENLHNRDTEIRKARDELEERVAERTTHLEQEITERKFMESSLRESEARLIAILDKSPYGVSIASRQTRKRLYVNQRLMDMFGAGSGKALLQGHVEDSYADPGDLDRNLSALQRDGQLRNVEQQRRRLDGSIWWADTDWSPISFIEDDAVMIWHHDITERKSAEEKIRESERRLSTLINNLPGMAYQSLDDEHWTMKFISEGCEDITGYAQEDIIDNRTIDFADIIVAEDRDHVRGVIDSAIAAGNTYQLAYRIQTKDGQVRHVWEKGVGNYDEHGEVATIEGIITDISELKETEQALRSAAQEIDEANRSLELKVAERTSELNEVNQQAEQAAELAQLGRWIWDTVEDRCLSCSKELARIHGVTVEEFMAYTNSTAQDEPWAHPEDRQRFIDLTHDAVAREVGYDIEYRIIGRDNVVRYVREIGEPILDGSGKQIQIRGTIQDITARKKTEEGLRVAMQVAETANRAKTDFLANMSHELRTPLNAIIGFSAIIKEAMFGPLDEQYQGYGEDINASGAHLLDIISDILDISRVEAGELVLVLEEIDLSDTVASCRTMTSDRADAAGIGLAFEIPEDLPVLHADPVRLKQILLNLIGNALKFTPSGGQIIVAGATSYEGGVILSVNDTGVGIAKEDITLVLEKFGQARVDHTRSHDGAGLGLALSKLLMEQHGGTLEIVSELNEGTTVTVTFPP